MKKRTRIAIFIAVAAIAVGIGGYQWARKARKATRAVQSNGEDTSDQPRSKEELALAKHYKNRRAINDFADALRSVFAWHSEHPVESEADRKAVIRTLVQKLRQVPSQELPKPFATAWSQLILCWAKLEAAPDAPPELVTEGKAAAAAMNMLLASEGYGDLQF